MILIYTVLKRGHILFFKKSMHTVPLLGRLVKFIRLLGNFAYFLSSADFFKMNFSKKNSFRNTIRVLNSLDSHQARRNVGPDLGPNCLQRLSADGR